MKQQFQHELAAEIGQHQDHEAGQGPGQGLLSAPAESVTTPQQGAEDQPGDDREQGLVDELGGIEKALAITRNLAGIPDDEKVDIVVFPKPPGFIRLLQSLFAPGFYGVSGSFSSQVRTWFEDSRQLPGLFIIVHLLRRDRLLYLSPFLFSFN